MALAIYGPGLVFVLFVSVGIVHMIVDNTAQRVERPGDHERGI